MSVMTQQPVIIVAVDWFLLIDSGWFTPSFMSVMTQQPVIVAVDWFLLIDSGWFTPSFMSVMTQQSVIIYKPLL